jgi:dihydroorotase
LIATHCEDETTIKYNLQLAKEEFGEDVPFEKHAEIRNAEACFLSSSMAVNLAKKHGTRLHVLHLTSELEMQLFDDTKPLKEKKITTEVCVHHLIFSKEDYAKYGWRIKWNPAVKEKSDRDALIKALKSGKLDIVATDHAPHTIEEKNSTYFKSPSGGPLVQHSLVAMLEFYHKGIFTLEEIVNKMCHAPAECFKVVNRGFIRPGYFADLCVIDLDSPWTVATENILYKSKWSPFEGFSFKSKVLKTFVNGNLVYDEGLIQEEKRGMRLTFNKHF